MSRIDTVFNNTRAVKRAALVTYVVAGDPHPRDTVAMMHALVEAGADIIELGIPFSDPMAEGPVIQWAHERALVHKVSLRDAMAMVQQFRATNTTTPVVLMGYLNPIEVMGYAAFAEAAQRSGVDGVLTVDLPPEEAEELAGCLRVRQLAPIFLIAPTTSPARLPGVCAQGQGFLYYVSLKGVTGAAHLDTDDVKSKLTEIRKHTALPLGVGFGIRDAASAKAIAGIADAVVVGSAIVQRVADAGGDSAKTLSAIKGFVGEIRRALNA
jgi:tryptophan synthase alpha chain